MTGRPQQGSRRVIPRPWLSDSRREAHNQQQSKRSQRVDTTATKEKDLEILEKLEWKVSWGKLSCCFCIKDQSNRARSGSSSTRKHHDNVLFPAFPAFRRNSSTSLISNGVDEVYPSGGSVSSFTESDKSTYSSFSIPGVDANNTETKESSPPRASTPPPDPIGRPPVISARSRSAGLPPMNPNLTMIAPNLPAARSRFDTGEFTGVSGFSGTTTTSRHRRRGQFHFSQRSMEEIWKGTSEKESIPPSFVLFEQGGNHGSGRIRRDSGNISALDDDMDWGSFTYDGDNEEDSPFAQLERKSPTKEPKIPIAQRPPKASRAKDTQKRTSSRQKQPRPLPPKKPAPVCEVVYLAKNPSLDNDSEGTLILSGWLAAFFGADSLDMRFRQGVSKGVQASDVYYLRIVDGLPNRGPAILLQSSKGSLDHVIPLQSEWMCESREVSSRIGRSVTIRSRRSHSMVICTLMPVSLDKSFFRPGGELVPSDEFNRLQSRLFVGGKGKVYAPDEQHDAAMFMMFSLDGLIKKCNFP